MSGYVGPGRLWVGTPGAPSIKNAWGTLLNANATQVQAMISETAVVSIDGKTTYTLTANNAASDQSRPAIQDYTGTLAGACTVTIPDVQRIGWAINDTMGSQNVLLTAGGGSKATVPPDADRMWMYSADGAGSVSLPPVGLDDLRVVTKLTVNGTASAANGTAGTNVVNFSQFDQTQGASGHLYFPGASNKLLLNWGRTAGSIVGGQAATFEESYGAAANIYWIVTQGYSGGSGIANESATVRTLDSNGGGFNIYTPVNVVYFWVALGIHA